MLKDRFGRPFSYLRVSLTERCNLHCCYCEPPQGLEDPSEQPLDFKRLSQILKAAHSLGMKKFRFTGGEPFMRPGVTRFLKDLRSDLKDCELHITTNGELLEKQWQEGLSEAVDGINFSIDSLDSRRFARVTGGGNLNTVLSGVETAIKCGIKVKVNVVALKDLDKEEIRNFVEFSAEKGVEVRFIEFMPLCGQGWNEDTYLSINVFKDLFFEMFKDAGDSVKSGVADVYHLSNKAKIGWISALSSPFCGECTRLRLSSQGALYPCLFSGSGVSLLDCKTDAEIQRQFQVAARMKGEGLGKDEISSEPSPPCTNPLIRLIGG